MRILQFLGLLPPERDEVPTIEQDFAADARQRKLRRANKIAEQVRARMLREGKLSPVVNRSKQDAKTS